jgi:dTDP-4-amino-4,6-dideoxygalactose transaminase
MDSIPLCSPARLQGATLTAAMADIETLQTTGTYRVPDGFARTAAERLVARIDAPKTWAVATTRSGTDALVRALAVSGVGAGDRVIVPDLAYHAVAASVMQLGGCPVFADINEDDFNLSVESVADCLASGGAKAVIAVDNYGTPCDLEGLRRVTADADVALILDACESLGADYRADLAATTDAVVYSFSFTKPVHSMGAGGALCAPVEAIERARSLPHLLLGPVQLPEVNAAYLCHAWQGLDANIERNRAQYAVYESFASSAGLTAQVDHGGSTRLHAPLLVAEASHRNPVVEALVAKGVESRAMFPLQSQLLGIGTTPPVAGSVAERVFALPSGPGLGMDAVHRVCEVLGEVLTEVGH